MRYSIHINAVKSQEWGLSLSQGALFDLLNQASSWAKNIIVEGEVYFWVSRHMVIDEIPLAYQKPDTVYRAFKELSEKGLIIHIKNGQKDLIRLTEKGKEWNAKNSEINPNLGNKSDFSDKKPEKNSEINPTFSQKLGNKSEKTPKNSDLNPTDKNTNYPNTNNQGSSEKNLQPQTLENSQTSTVEKNQVTEEMITQAIDYLKNQGLLNSFEPVNREEIRFEINQSMQYAQDKKPVLVTLAKYLKTLPATERVARFQTLPQHTAPVVNGFDEIIPTQTAPSVLAKIAQARANRKVFNPSEWGATA